MSACISLIPQCQLCVFNGHRGSKAMCPYVAGPLPFAVVHGFAQAVPALINAEGSA